MTARDQAAAAPLMAGTLAPRAGEREWWQGPGRVRAEVQTISGRAAAVEFRVRLDTVEVWHHGRCSGVLVRDVLREWLSDPVGKDPLVVDEVMVSLDLLMDRDAGRVAITLPDVREWALSPSEETWLREEVSQ